MHYYQFNISDFCLHTSHLTLEEEGVYRRLIDFYYDTEQPIPKETKPVIRRLRLGNYVDEVEQILAEFFTLEDDGYHNYRCDIEIKLYQERVDKARENGKKGGRPRKNTGLETQSVILANPQESESKANYELITNNQELIKDTAVSKIPPCPHDEIIDLYHEILPELPSITKSLWAGSVSEKDLRARWKQHENHQSLDFWQRYFTAIKRIDWYFEGVGTGDFANWSANLKWLIKRKNFDNTIDRLRNLK